MKSLTAMIENNELFKSNSGVKKRNLLSSFAKQVSFGNSTASPIMLYIPRL